MDLNGLEKIAEWVNYKGENTKFCLGISFQLKPNPVILRWFLFNVDKFNYGYDWQLKEMNNY